MYLCIKNVYRNPACEHNNVSTLRQADAAAADASLQVDNFFVPVHLLACCSLQSYVPALVCSCMFMCVGMTWVCPTITARRQFVSLFLLTLYYYSFLVCVCLASSGQRATTSSSPSHEPLFRLLVIAFLFSFSLSLFY